MKNFDFVIAVRFMREIQLDKQNLFRYNYTTGVDACERLPVLRETHV